MVEYLKLNNLTNFIILYFRSRNLERFGFCRYGVFKRIIKYALDTQDLTLVRRVFDLVRSRGVIDETELQNTKVYLFNENHRPYKRHLNGLVDFTD